MAGFFEWLGNLIKSCIDAVIGFFYGLWEGFWAILCGVGAFFVDCWNYLWGWCSWCFYVSIDWILRQFVGILDLLATKIEFDVDFSAYQTIFETVAHLNAWLPLDTVFYCASFYFSIMFVWIVYKFVKSWIPTVSG